MNKYEDLTEQKIKEILGELFIPSGLLSDNIHASPAGMKAFDKVMKEELKKFKKVMTPEELREQELMEARNIIWKD